VSGRDRLARPARGEITLLVGPADTAEARSQPDSAQSLAARVQELMHQAKLGRKEALKLAGRERGLTKRAAYDELVNSRPSDLSGKE